MWWVVSHRPGPRVNRNNAPFSTVRRAEAEEAEEQEGGENPGNGGVGVLGARARENRPRGTYREYGGRENWRLPGSDVHRDDASGLSTYVRTSTAGVHRSRNNARTDDSAKARECHEMKSKQSISNRCAQELCRAAAQGVGVQRPIADPAGVNERERMSALAVGRLAEPRAMGHETWPTLEHPWRPERTREGRHLGRRPR